MTRVLLLAALAVSLVVPVGSVALAATSSGSSTDQEAIEMPTTPTANPDNAADIDTGRAVNQSAPETGRARTLERANLARSAASNSIR